MKPQNLRLSAEAAATLSAAVKSFHAKEIFDGITYESIFAEVSEKSRKIKEDNGTFDVIISTDALDRAGEIVKQDGWDFTNYKNNPIVLWGHDYYSLPIGICLNIQVEGTKTRAQGIFLSADINPFAQQVRKLYEFGSKMGRGVGCTTSVGFIPKEFDQQNSSIITKAELLEFSFVDVPAQAGVGDASGRALSFKEAQEIGLDLFAARVKGINIVKGAEVGDDCQTDDGSPGKLATDPKDPGGAMICLPKNDDKSANESGDDANEDKDADAAAKFTEKVGKEHERHTKSVKKEIDTFKTKAAEIASQTDNEGGEHAADDGEKKKAAQEAVKTSLLKALDVFKDSLADEHEMHRSKSLDIFKSFKPPEEKEKSIDIEKTLKALRAEHAGYQTKCTDSLDKFSQKSIEVGYNDEHLAKMENEMGKHQEKHLAGVEKCAKSICAGFGEGETTESGKNFIGELKSILKAEGVSDEVIEKVGAKLSSATKDKLQEAHDHITKGLDIVKAIHGGIGNDPAADDDDDQDDQQGTDGKKDVHDASSDDEFKQFKSLRDLARALSGSVNDFNARSNEFLRDYYGNAKK